MRTMIEIATRSANARWLSALWHPRRPLFWAPVSLALALIVAASQPASAETPAAYMQRVANELLAASRSGANSGVAFAAAIRSHADVPSIGLSALGSYATSLPKSDRPSYFNGMVNWMARYAAKEARNYQIAKAIMVGQSTESGGIALVDSRVVLRSGTSYDVRWRLVKRGAVYKVRDAEVLGFGMTSQLNTMFQNYISENGGNPKSLVVALNK